MSSARDVGPIYTFSLFVRRGDTSIQGTLDATLYIRSIARAAAGSIVVCCVWRRRAVTERLREQLSRGRVHPSMQYEVARAAPWSATIRFRGPLALSPTRIITHSLSPYTSLGIDNGLTHRSASAALAPRLHCSSMCSSRHTSVCRNRL